MSILHEVHLTPAYGRDYTSAEHARKDFLAGKDFRFHHFSGESRYCSIRDFISDGVTSTFIRYNNLRDSTMCPIPEEHEEDHNCAQTCGVRH